MAPPTLTERVTRILEARFPGVIVALEPASSPDRIGGWIVWGGFDGRDHVERRRLLKDALSGLTPEDRLSLGPILTLTPSEASDEQAA